ncbi:MAG: sigma-54 dependent transcriptional regulator [Chthoniobacter sp.]|uniref:sigma-54-dependent transcriptional regulator n=1 Tax=Chthoniobacter sp. TaxID=2510640 RepID=UPI0032ADFB1A
MARKPNILLVDDDEHLRIAAGKVLKSEGYRVASAASGREALESLQEPGVALLISDLRLPDIDGIALLKQALELRPEIEVVMITGHGSIEQAVEAMRLGAYDFIQKPLDATALVKTVAKALEKQRLASENEQLRQQLQQRSGAEAHIGNGPAMRAVQELIRQVAATDVHVLIQGESGTGKEIVANALHELSDRRGKPFVKLSCAAIPETLLESELFGHERGAFTGANATKPGKLELADGGTVLLDEIAEMTPPLQAKLLRVLQDGVFQRVGGTRDIHSNFRLLCATHSDLARAIEEKSFRHDLYYRIHTVQIAIPPLRERREDIPLLAAHFLERFSARMRKEVRSLAPSAREQLLAHDWPGNVRELQHVVERAVALTDGDMVECVAFAPAPGGKTAVTASANGSSISIPLGTSLDEATKQLVEATIAQCGGNKLKAAQVLGIPPRTMYRHFSHPAELGHAATMAAP